MIRFRMAEFVPPSAFGLAYITNQRATPEDNLSLIGPDEEAVSNIVDYFGNEVTVQYSADYLNTTDVVLSNRSVVSREVRRPIPLYYDYTLGRGVYDLYSRNAEAGATDQEVLDSIRSCITILDSDNNVTPAVKWDICHTRVGTNRFRVVLYTDRRCQNNKTYKVRFPAITAGGTIVYNHIEIINAEPVLAETDYSLTYYPGTGYLLSGISSGELAPALALYGDSLPYNVQADRISFGAGGAISVSTVTSTGVVPVEDVAADINALDAAVYATPLSMHDETGTLLVQGPGVAAPEGTVVRFNDIVHARYSEERRVYLEHPYAADSMERWYPRVNAGEYHTATGDYDIYYSVRDVLYQPYSASLGYPYRHIYNEEPAQLGKKIVQISRHPLHSTGELAAFQNGTTATLTHIVQDVDLQNGIIFLNDRYREDTNLAFSYAYKEDYFEYTDVDLNPVLNQDLHGKFVGVYLLPYIIESAVRVYQFERTVYHTIQDTYQDVVDAMATIVLSDGTPGFPTLLGVFFISQKNDKTQLVPIDARNAGGGLREDLVPSDTGERESEMFWDIGRWDGRPVQDRGTIIIEYPEEVLGTDSRFKIVPESLYMDFATGWLIPTGLYAEDDILRAAQKHTKAGALPILDKQTATGTYYPNDFNVYDPSAPGAEWA